jgi:hypothetical protein
VRPGARQAWQAVFILRQFNLQDAFAGVGVLRENVQDNRGAVENPHVLAKFFLQFALVIGRQLSIKNDDVGQGFLHQ